MNIFYLHNDTKICAEMHVDKHCVKMILESCQLLSTAHRVLDGKEYVDSSSGRRIKRWKLNDSDLDNLLYKATHINHPSAIWVRQSYENYMWLHSLLVELCKEYTYRYGKMHKCETIGLVNTLSYAPFNIPVKVFTEPTPAMPIEYIVKGDSIQSYHNYYNGAKVKLFSWKNRSVPRFITKENNHESIPIDIVGDTFIHVL
jgi:hypothetical protein